MIGRGLRTARSTFSDPAVPPKSWILTMGGVAGLSIQAAAQLLAPGLSWRREFARQYIFAFRVTLIPATVVAFVIGFSTIGIQGGSLASAFGAIDRISSVAPIAFLRELGPLLTTRDRRRHARLDDHRRDRRPQDPPGDRGARDPRHQPGPQPRPAARSSRSPLMMPVLSLLALLGRDRRHASARRSSSTARPPARSSTQLLTADQLRSISGAATVKSDPVRIADRGDRLLQGARGRRRRRGRRPRRQRVRRHQPGRDLRWSASSTPSCSWPSTPRRTPADGAPPDPPSRPRRRRVEPPIERARAAIAEPEHVPARRRGRRATPSSSGDGVAACAASAATPREVAAPDGADRDRQHAGHRLRSRSSRGRPAGSRARRSRRALGAGIAGADVQRLLHHPRGRAVHLRLHRRRQGRRRDRRPARRDAGQRGGRRARGDGRPARSPTWSSPGCSPRC